MNVVMTRSATAVISSLLTVSTQIEQKAVEPLGFKHAAMVTDRDDWIGLLQFPGVYGTPE